MKVAGEIKNVLNETSAVETRYR